MHVRGYISSIIIHYMKILGKLMTCVAAGDPTMPDLLQLINGKFDDLNVRLDRFEGDIKALKTNVKQMSTTVGFVNERLFRLEMQRSYG
jgi:hypothetical protein